MRQCGGAVTSCSFLKMLVAPLHLHLLLLHMVRGCFYFLPSGPICLENITGFNQNL